jgi:DNA ligase-1
MSKTIELEKPILASKARTGKSKFWQVRVFTDTEGAHVEREWWVEGGKHSFAGRQVQGKNIGRSNETTPLAQALLEAEAEYKKQLDDGYQAYDENAPAEAIGSANTQTGLLLPMLAHDFTKRGKKLDWSQGMFAQPKLDGFRCLYNSKIGFWSRGGKPFDQAVDLSHLQWDTGGITYDGELILPPPYTFQQTCQAIKKQRDETRLLEFHIFDAVLENEPFHKRYFHLQDEVRWQKPAQVVLVDTKLIKDVDEASMWQAIYMEQGYEGLILRTQDGLYDVGNRSPDLLKYKIFQDEDFIIVNVTDGVGREKGAAIFECATKQGSIFAVRPKGSYEDRQAQFQNREVLVGQWLTVRFQDYTSSESPVPRFPIGIRLRPAFDL